MKSIVLSFFLLITILVDAIHNQQFVVGCYFTNWSQYRQGLGHFTPTHIDPSLCTHLYYAFANIDTKTRSPSPFELHDIQPLPIKSNNQIKPSSIGMYEQLNFLKTKNRKMKTLLSLGGASVNSTQFQRIFESDRIRKEFIRNTIIYLRKYKFDGLDIDWEFPQTENDRRIFSLIIRDYRYEFQHEASLTNRPRLLLTAAVAAYGPKIEAAYDIKEITPYLDYVNLMAYDYHGHWNSYIGFNSPLYPRSTEKDDQRLLNQQATINTWIKGGCPRSKLVLGLGLYGRTFQLKQKKNPNIKPYAPSKGAGLPGNFTDSKGFLSYYEICNLIKKHKWSTEYDKEQQVPYSYKDDQWVGYDNLQSIEKKCSYIAEQRLAGAMIWSLDLDDFNGTFCGQGKYPLLTKIKKHLRN